MGVKGLWSLLSPVARPIKLETLEGKRLAIDSSIWLYQFQATMRDKDGRVLVNAHVLGFLRRINKLLFHGIKPVFVFDGGAPNLKRSTIAERKRKKMGAAANHAKVAEKLFAAQMRREAVKAAQAAREKQIIEATSYIPSDAAYEYQPEVGDIITADDVYLDELDGPQQHRPRLASARTSSSMTSEGAGPSNHHGQTIDEAEQIAVAQAERRKKFKNADPYRLPDLPGPIGISSTQVTNGKTKPDPRMATEDELKTFIDTMKPEDFDVNSPEFRTLPTDVQYEIIGDLRIRSRQQSHRRLASMLRAAPTPLDFSKAQIANLSKRNTLTQQLLTVTDTIGSSGLQIPVRVASERNREYVLVRNTEAEGGGWVLGVRDQGSKDKPIVIEESPQSRKKKEAKARAWLDSDEEDSDVEEIPKPDPVVDPDLRKMRQKEMLEALTRRLTPRKVGSLTDLQVKPRKTPIGARPLFAENEDEEVVVPPKRTGDMEEQFQLDEAIAASLQESSFAARGDGPRQLIHAEDSDEEDEALQRALAASHHDARLRFDAAGPATASGTVTATASEEGEDSDDESMEEVIMPHSVSTTPEATYMTPLQEKEDQFVEVDVSNYQRQVKPGDNATPSKLVYTDQAEVTTTEQVEPPAAKQDDFPYNNLLRVISTGVSSPEEARRHSIADIIPTSGRDAKTPPPMKTITQPNSVVKQPLLTGPSLYPNTSSVAEAVSSATPRPLITRKVSSAVTTVRLEGSKAEALGSPFDESPVNLYSLEEGRSLASEEPRLPAADCSDALPSTSELLQKADEALRAVSEPTEITQPSPALNGASEDDDEIYDDNLSRALLRQLTKTPENDGLSEEDEDMDDSRSFEWSKSPSPRRHTDGEFPPPPEDLEEDEGGIDINAEGDDYARFIAQIKGRNLEQVRQEIDNEIRTLNMQNKVAMRDSEDITQQMVAQIQLLLRLFGIPYITAPMEAEAQCAKLAELNLVDGVITDDNDVFLFGGAQCFKNLFNDAKYVECFLSSDLDRELSLTRERLITIAYLLGSDYTIGLPHVGPIVAMELMANFPGSNGLQNFKKWWLDVQQGRDNTKHETKWMKGFKKKYSDVIFLGADWPNPLVREAYNRPTVDESDEPFQWGFPDLNGLRIFLQTELSWSISKADDELTPIVQRIARRGQIGALHKQTRLDPFFDMSLGANAYIPRVRTKHPSKRLQSVIKAYREAEARARGEDVPMGFGEMLADLNDPDELVKVDDFDDGQKPTKKTKARKREPRDVDGDEPKSRRVTKKKSATIEATDADLAAVPPPQKTRKAPSRTGSTSSERGRGRGRARGRAGTPLFRASSTMDTGVEDVAESPSAMEESEIRQGVAARPKPRTEGKITI